MCPRRRLRTIRDARSCVPIRDSDYRRRIGEDWSETPAPVGRFVIPTVATSRSAAPPEVPATRRVPGTAPRRVPGTAPRTQPCADHALRHPTGEVARNSQTSDADVTDIVDEIRDLWQDGPCRRHPAGPTPSLEAPCP